MDGRTPLIVCVNHCSWWDVLVGLFMETELFGCEWYTMMDARQLQRYRFFCRLGVIGVDRWLAQRTRPCLSAETQPVAPPAALCVLGRAYDRAWNPEQNRFDLTPGALFTLTVEHLRTHLG